MASSPLVPRLDPTLLFANAGMNQFKGVFTGEEKRKYKRATSSQKCVRAGGKHNDLENVGRTARHHTFFEMLGNFSFGDYFKKEAIGFAWEFVTKELKLPKDKLYVSIFREDEDAFEIWNKKIGIDAKRIYRFGERDNFWSMGEVGPCGPCSEIFYDQGKEAGCGKPDCDVGCSCDRYLEFWNLVFMEFEQKADGTRVKLPKPSIDTGSGLERLAAIVQGVKSNYDTDLFQPLLTTIAGRTGKEYSKEDEETRISMRVMADHIRAITFLIGDGARPSNEGRGYVLRRIVRRAMRHAWKLGITKPYLHQLSHEVVELMGKAYPELQTNGPSTAEIICAEEEKFHGTLDRGLAILSEEMTKLLASGKNTFPGDIAFRLYETFGFPADMTADILSEKKIVIDQAAFEEASAAHREKARGSWKGSAQKAIDSLARGWVAKGFRSEFLGYQTIASPGVIKHLVRDGKEVNQAKMGEEVELVADRTSFYGESGGQVGDIGSITGDGFSIEVIDTQKPVPDIIVHRGHVTEGFISTGAKGEFNVDSEARSATAKNHTATHMLHATLKEILGSHVKQEGSLVSPERLRFDFSHPAALTPAQISAIEQKMNERIWLDSKVKKEILPLETALKSGAVALFDEKYGQQVRVLTIDEYSKELCGGTHLDRTGEIGLFKIIRESSVSAGVRRIDAFTGYRALHYLQEGESKLRELSSLLGTSTEELGTRVDKLLARQKELEKEIKKLKSQPGGNGSANQKIETLNGIFFLTSEIESEDPRELREMADRQLEKLKSGIVVIGAKSAQKASLVVKISRDLTPKFEANKMVSAAAKVLGGSGGGRPDMAQAGGPNVDALQAAFENIRKSVTSI